MCTILHIFYESTIFWRVSYPLHCASTHTRLWFMSKLNKSPFFSIFRRGNTLLRFETFYSHLILFLDLHIWACILLFQSYRNTIYFNLTTILSGLDNDVFNEVWNYSIDCACHEKWISFLCSFWGCYVEKIVFITIIDTQKPTILKLTRHVQQITLSKGRSIFGYDDIWHMIWCLGCRSNALQTFRIHLSHLLIF